MRIHTGERPYTCKFPGCGSSFITRGHLKDHSRMHTNDRPYLCPHCTRGFMRSTTLKVHLRVHSGERPYLCPYPGCGRTFTESGNLNTHKKLHNGQQNSKQRKKSRGIKKKKIITQSNSAFTPYRSNYGPQQLETLGQALSKVEVLQGTKSIALTAAKVSEIDIKTYLPQTISKQTNDMMHINYRCLYPCNPYELLIGNSVGQPMTTSMQLQGFNEFPMFSLQKRETGINLPYPVGDIISQPFDSRLILQSNGCEDGK